MTARGILKYFYFLSSKTYLKRLSKSITTGHFFIIKVKKYFIMKSITYNNLQMSAIVQMLAQM